MHIFLCNLEPKFIFSTFIVCFFSSLSRSPFSIFKEDEGLQKKDFFFILEPSEESNGCFLAVLKREVRPQKQVVSLIREKAQSW